ncbi:hypothetical protein BV898_17474 [Hypsibius exemplaris]|uniref:Secreted protein n=1 Tax=Hypsibius exemplaris TaxID=2072580 RepID=A0A9X6NHB9_HYPEX|nr:hypothetical protein BV898_17474 [Hypsibius exemplaris]
MWNLVVFFALCSVLARTYAAPAAGPTCSRETTSSAVSSAFAFLDNVSNLTRDYNANVTPQKIASLCRDGQLLKASETFVNKCVAMNVPGIRELLAGSVKLLDVCKSSEADIVAKLQSKQACEKKMLTSVPSFATCLSRMATVFDGLERDVKQPNFPSVGIQLSAVCCSLKNYDDCLGQNYQKSFRRVLADMMFRFDEGSYPGYKKSPSSFLLEKSCPLTCLLVTGQIF